LRKLVEYEDDYIRPAVEERAQAAQAKKKRRLSEQ
jgi:hypothetical protein